MFLAQVLGVINAVTYLMEQALKLIQSVTPYHSLLLHQWTNLARQAVTVALSVRSWVRLMITFLRVCSTMHSRQ